MKVKIHHKIHQCNNSKSNQKYEPAMETKAKNQDGSTQAPGPKLLLSQVPESRINVRVVLYEIEIIVSTHTIAELNGQVS